MVSLFPQPREVAFGRGTGSARELEVRPDPRLPAQGYELAIGATGTRITHADEAGLRYARHTLAQLDAAPVVPAGRIRDWPDFAVRGFLLDISRDRVPTMDTLAWLVETLAQLRYNHLELYTEHTFAYPDHQAVWRDASPVTPDELRDLDARCRAGGIELSANQSTFGHMERWLAHPAYCDRAECPDGSEHPLFRTRLPPWSLEPTPGNAEFALGLVRQMCGQLTSSRININADEPFDLGQGRSKAAVAERGRAAVFVEHLHRLVEPLVEEGREVRFWGDVVIRHPELVKLLPEGATAGVWTYEAPRPDGPSTEAIIGTEAAELLGLPSQDHLGFSAFVEPFVDAGYPFWVCPGTSSWGSVAGRWSNARRNLLDAARVGVEHGAQGFLVTDWGDNGHHQPLVVSVLPAAYGAGVAWCRATNEAADVTPVVDRLLGAHDGLGSHLTRLGNLYARLGATAVNGSPLLLGILKTQRHLVRGELGATAANEAEALIHQALDCFTAPSFRGPRAELLAADLTAAGRLLRHGLWRLRQTRGDGRVDTARLARDFTEVVELQRAAWLGTSRPGGLADSIAKLAPPP